MIIYESDSRDKLSVEILFSSISSIDPLLIDRQVFAFVIHSSQGDTYLSVDDDRTRTYDLKPFPILGTGFLTFHL